MTKNENFSTKIFEIFFFRIDSECFKTYFKPKMWISKKFSRWKFFSGTLPFFRKWPHGENFRPKFCKNIFSQSIQNVSKRIFVFHINCFKFRKLLGGSAWNFINIGGPGTPQDPRDPHYVRLWGVRAPKGEGGGTKGPVPPSHFSRNTWKKGTITEN